MIVSSSDREGVDVEYTFGQVGVDKPVIDWSGNCGNLTSAIGVFAIREGLVDGTSPETDLTLYNTNTDTRIEQTIPMESGEPAVRGDYAVDGVPGTGARIDSKFLDPAGGVTGELFPTGHPIDDLDVDGKSVEVSFVDVANPNVFVRASDLGLSGTELPEALASDQGLVDHIERIRAHGCVAMGLIDNPELATEERPGIPQIAIVSEPQAYETSVGGTVDPDTIDITARIFTTGTPHHAYAMTGAMCLGAAARLPGTIPNDCAIEGDAVTIGHPKGRITVGVEIKDNGVSSVTVARTARPLMDGGVYFRPVGALDGLMGR
jgi:2-methylaconitate cis-trans-isomerase PrpF